MQAELPLSRISEVRYSQVLVKQQAGWYWRNLGNMMGLAEMRWRQSLHKPYPITSCGEWAERNLLFLTNVTAVAHKCPSNRITIALNCQVK